MSACSVTLSPPPSSGEVSPLAGSATLSMVGAFSGNKYSVNSSNQVTVTETRDLIPFLSAGWQ